LVLICLLVFLFFFEVVIKTLTANPIGDFDLESFSSSTQLRVSPSALTFSHQNLTEKMRSFFMIFVLLLGAL